MNAPTCTHCGGRVVPEREDARDEPVLKCLACSRYASPPRAHEEPARDNRKVGFVPGMGEYLDSEHYREAQREWHRKAWQKKKAGA